jgi:HD-like signal output (HDOD) protein
MPASHKRRPGQPYNPGINNALEKRQVAGVPEVIHLIQELSTKAFSITIKELAEIISQDVAVTAKVISAANTVGYNPTACR